jgi:ABC-type phosphate transport system auxiliary subunit
MTSVKQTAVLELTREQIAQELDREAQRRLHISGEELVRRYRTGQLDDCGKVADLLALASLLAEDDPLFAAA